jgi:hypothetical protein
VIQNSVAKFQKQRDGFKNRMMMIQNRVVSIQNRASMIQNRVV